MASNLSTLLLKLKANALKSLAVAVGVNSTGPKAQIAARIAKTCCEDVGFFDRSLKCCGGERAQSKVESELGAEARQETKRVLSIDMGIRNLALCVIEVPTGGKSPVGGALPKVIAWETIAVIERPVEAPVIPEKQALETDSVVMKQKRRKKLESAYLDQPKTSAKSQKPKNKTESFEPSKFAVLANNFVQTTLSRFSPDAIIIEQQRYRSHGAPAIQQWTVRVNMFEAMLHALFYSVGCAGHGEDVRRKSPAAESVSPSRVSGFWIDKAAKKFEVKNDILRNDHSFRLEEGVEKESEEQKAAEKMGERDGIETDEDLGIVNKNADIELEGRKAFKDIKHAKIYLVSEWIKSGDVISFNQEVADTVGNFFSPKTVNGRKPRKKTPGNKLDDLADCLLQGVAWLRWEENRRSLAEGKLIPEILPCKCTSCQGNDS